MNMKHSFKLPLTLILYSAICMIFIGSSMYFDTKICNNSEEKYSESILSPYINTTIDSNKLTTIKELVPPDNINGTTLSRGYIDDLDNIPTQSKESENYEQDSYTLQKNNLIDGYNEKKAMNSSNIDDSKEIEVVNAHLPDYLMYKNVNVSDLKNFLRSRDSLLAEEPYFSTILSVSKDFNLNPLAMFAITGQEQSFVPKSSKNAYKIANNPFNVFNSWKKYNTDIDDASNIAARTIVNLCKNRPDNMDAFTWVNRKYSEDQDWSKAVRSIFEDLESSVAYNN